MDPDKTVLEVVQEGVQDVMDILKEYNDISMKFMEPMDDDEMNRLIERQGELTEKIDHIGGWEIDSKLARAMDGDITVESVYGHGTTFHMNLFQRMGEDEDEAIGAGTAAALRDDNYEPEEKTDSFEYHAHPGRRVLVVDDSRINLMVARGLLAPYSMQVDVAPGGQEALVLASQNKYDMILMDHMMPEMDGVETLHAIRDLGGHNSRVPVIALTANAVDGTCEMLLSEGMQDFISKPIDKKLLNDVIEKYC